MFGIAIHITTFNLIFFSQIDISAVNSGIAEFIGSKRLLHVEIFFRLPLGKQFIVVIELSGVQFGLKSYA